MNQDADKTIRLLICDDQAIVCEGLRAMLSPITQIEVIGVANNGAEAIDLTRRLQPDLVLMDLKMPRMNGIQATKVIHEQFPGVHVLVPVPRPVQALRLGRTAPPRDHIPIVQNFRPG